MPKSAYTVQEARQEFGISEEMIRANIKAGTLVAYRTAEHGGRYIIRHEDFEKWLDTLPRA